MIQNSGNSAAGGHIFPNLQNPGFVNPNMGLVDLFLSKCPAFTFQKRVAGVWEAGCTHSLCCLKLHKRDKKNNNFKSSDHHLQSGVPFSRIFGICFKPLLLGLLPWGFNYILCVTSNETERYFSSLMNAQKVGRVTHSGDPPICHCRCHRLWNGCEPQR